MTVIGIVRNCSRVNHCTAEYNRRRILRGVQTNPVLGMSAEVMTIRSCEIIHCNHRRLIHKRFPMAPEGLRSGECGECGGQAICLPCSIFLPGYSA
ncbi:hypothetical protein TNCV_4240971 [Trichonephila clavipes]|nr:hypothetical protein TNCV_4240971 [Trichonephila clavipes]